MIRKNISKSLLCLIIVTLILSAFLFACKKPESTVDFNMDNSFDVTQEQYEEITLEELRSAVNSDTIAALQPIKVTYKEWTATMDKITCLANGYYIPKDEQVKSAIKNTTFYQSTVNDNGNITVTMKISGITYQYYNGEYLAEQASDGTKTKRALTTGYAFYAGSDYISLTLALDYVNSNRYSRYEVNKAVNGDSVMYFFSFIPSGDLNTFYLYFVFEGNSFSKAYFMKRSSMGNEAYTYILPFDGDITLPDFNDYAIEEE